MKRKERTTGILQYSICSLLVLLLGSGCQSSSTPKQGGSDRHEVSDERVEFKETMSSIQGKFDHLSRERVKLEGEVLEWKRSYNQQKSSYQGKIDQLSKERVKLEGDVLEWKKSYSQQKSSYDQLKKPRRTRRQS